MGTTRARDCDATREQAGGRPLDHREVGSRRGRRAARGAKRHQKPPWINIKQRRRPAGLCREPAGLCWDKMNRCVRGVREVGLIGLLAKRGGLREWICLFGRTKKKEQRRGCQASPNNRAHTTPTPVTIFNIQIHLHFYTTSNILIAHCQYRMGSV